MGQNHSAQTALPHRPTAPPPYRGGGWWGGGGQQDVISGGGAVEQWGAVPFGAAGPSPIRVRPNRWGGGGPCVNAGGDRGYHSGMKRELTSPAEPREPQPRPLRRSLVEAIRILTLEGTTQKEAAERSGMTEHGLQRALTRPHVQSYRDGMLSAHLNGKTPKAWNVVHKLMEGAASEDVQLKAARTHLEAFGQISGLGASTSPGPTQVIQIVCNSAAVAEPYMPRPGVIEAPPLDYQPGHR